MAFPPYDHAAISARLARLDDRRQLSFGAVCCERLLPNYLVFSQDASWGDVARLRRALDRIWAHLDSTTLAQTEAEGLFADVDAVVPDSDDFDSLYTAAAQDACFSVCALCDFVLAPEVEHIANVARYATDSVDLYVQEIEQMEPQDPALEQKIVAHRLMQRELAQQQQDLDAIEAAPAIDGAFLARLRASWPHPGKSNLDLP